MEKILVALKSAEDKLTELKKVLEGIDAGATAAQWKNIGDRCKTLAKEIKEAEQSLVGSKKWLLYKLLDATVSYNLPHGQSTRIGQWSDIGMHSSMGVMFLYDEKHASTDLGADKFCSSAEFESLYYELCRQRVTIIEKYLTDVAPPQIAKTKEDAEKFKPLVIELSRLVQLVESKSAA